MNKLLRLLGWAFRPISQNAIFMVFMFALGYYCTQTQITLHLRGAKPYPLSAAELFFDLYILGILLILLPRKARKALKCLLAFVLYTVALIDMFCYVKFESTLTPTMLMLFFETTGGEATEFLQSYLTADVLMSKVGVIVLIALLHAVVLAVRAVLRRKMAAGIKLNQPFERTAAAILGIVSIAMAVWCGSLCWPNKVAMARLLTQPTIGDVEHELTRQECATLYLPIYRLHFSLYANYLARQQLTQLLRAADDIAVDSCTSCSPDIVLIIGESYNRHRSQLYGYPYPTTPRQMRRAQDSSLVAYTDVVAPWNLTSYAFKHILSLHAIGDSGEWCDQPLFPELFRRAGYHVTFITNQFQSNAAEKVYDFSGGFFLNNQKLSNRLFDTRNRRLHRYDDGVLKDYDELAKSVSELNDSATAARRLTIFHLMGQHVSYAYRTPADRKVFKATDYDRPDLEPRFLQVMADYDNAVLYNDSIVDAILTRFEDKDAIVIYMPDHGEECFNGKLPFYGRMHSTEIDRRLAREEFEIPFWIWTSAKFSQQHPAVVAAVRACRHRPFMTDNLPHMLLSLGGIHCKYYKKAYDLLHADYDKRRPRLLKNSVDYNQLLKNEK